VICVPVIFRMKKEKLNLLVLTFALLLTTGCSSFNREWKATAAAPPAPGSIEGAWVGTWLSDHNGHHGGLRAIITKLDTDRYHTRFHATYMKILTFGQAVDLDVRQDGTNFTFSGAADLGKAYGGLYQYKGNSSPNGFYSTYNCSIDNGTFRMKRPE